MSSETAQKPATEIEELLDLVAAYNPDVDRDLLIRAYDFATAAHAGQQRLTGDPYIVHPLAVARLLTELEMDDATLAAALLHDVVEDTEHDVAEIRARFSNEIALLVDGVTKLRRIQFDSGRERQAENLRRMLLAMASDLRVILIKLADRVHNMRTLKPLPKERRQEVAQETLQILAPIAHRLGIWRFKFELEDRAFRHLEPEKYAEIVAAVDATREEREQRIQHAVTQLREQLTEMGISAEIEGRPKHLYSIYQKMQKEAVDFDQILDLEAIRVIVDTETQCYTVLGVVHSLWLPLPDMFTDYIAKPKSNMYQSLHTKAIGPDGEPLEVQIRTWAMHRRAEYGVAAHWRYKEGPTGDLEADTKLSWLRRLLDLHTDLRDPHEWLESLKLDLFRDQVFVFTPKGDVIDLPAGSTPVDFAYRIHTEVGNSCVGAKVNGRMVPLNYVFRNGDVAEIMTSNRPDAKPSLDWLSFVASSPARSKIKAWYRRAQREESISRGRARLEEECSRLGVDPEKTLAEKQLSELASKLTYSSVDDIYAAVGYGDISAETIIRRLRGETPKAKKKRTAQSDQGALRVAISAGGLTDLLFRLSRCCAPVPGDEIVGFITRGRGVTVHRAECPNVKHYAKQDAERLISLEWTLDPEAYFPVSIDLESLDRVGLVSDITTIISGMGTNILEARVQTGGKPKVARISLRVEVKSLDHLEQIINRIGALSDVLRVERARRG
ncbi:MAG: bifunctional (p)ppGpp synthetase/guanosine-3',5'-bis(diphosphate) 3'-pyrophosphohydrolase [Armatimonadetes bacterium]|nr:bifunctional (p)ppGpp synthetase/guanosine-3',5'-bis(diphosphate) 3'-pyrophosphohydrolase [Armatimonadota bacterium]